MYAFFESEILGLSAQVANWIANGLILLVGLIVLYILYRLITRPRLASGRRSKHARLAITDAASVDDRRKLVLVRRDDVEHLIMIGGANDMVIESDIRRNAPARPITQPGQQPTAVAPQAPAMAPAPAAHAPLPPSIAPATAATPAPAPAPAPVLPASSAPPAVNAPREPVTAAPRPAAAPPAPPTPSPNVAASAPQVSTSESARPTVMSSPAPAPANERATLPAVAARTEPDIVDDMDALLNEITGNKR